MREAIAGGRGGRGGRADVNAPQSSPRGRGSCGGELKGKTKVSWASERKGREKSKKKKRRMMDINSIYHIVYNITMMQKFALM